MARLLFGTPPVFLFFSTEMRGALVCSSAHTVGIRLAKASYTYRSPVTIRHPSGHQLRSYSFLHAEPAILAEILLLIWILIKCCGPALAMGICHVTDKIISVGYFRVV